MDKEHPPKVDIVTNPPGDEDDSAGGGDDDSTVSNAGSDIVVALSTATATSPAARAVASRA